jgi:hypothetical protein
MNTWHPAYNMADCVAALQVHMLQQLLDVGLADAAGVAEDSADSSAGAASDVTRARIIAQQKVSHTAWYPTGHGIPPPHGIPHRMVSRSCKRRGLSGIGLTGKPCPVPLTPIPLMPIPLSAHPT